MNTDLYVGTGYEYSDNILSSQINTNTGCHSRDHAYLFRPRQLLFLSSSFGGVLNQVVQTYCGWTSMIFGDGELLITVSVVEVMVDMLVYYDIFVSTMGVVSLRMTSCSLRLSLVCVCIPFGF